MYGCVVGLQQSAFNSLSCRDKPRHNSYNPPKLSTVNTRRHDDSDDKDISRKDLCILFNDTSYMNVFVLKFAKC